MLIWRACTRDVGAIKERSVKNTGSGMGIGGGGRHGHLDFLTLSTVDGASVADGRTLVELDLRLSIGVLHVDPITSHHQPAHHHTDRRPPTAKTKTTSSS